MKNVFGIFSSEDVECLKALIEKLEQSSFDYMKLENDGASIVIGKNGVLEGEAPAVPAAVSAAPVPAPAAVPEPVSEPVEQAEAAPAPEAQPQKAAAQDEGVVYLKSPSYGLFYAQSEPGAPAYVKVGDHIQVGDTVCLIEIMKTYTAMTSNVSGTVVEILVNNQDAVEPEQPLFAVKAD